MIAFLTLVISISEHKNGLEHLSHCIYLFAFFNTNIYCWIKGRIWAFLSSNWWEENGKTMQKRRIRHKWGKAFEVGEVLNIASSSSCNSQGVKKW